MQAEGTLQLVAEIAVAFAGFTSIIAVFGNRGGEGWSEREAVYLHMLVEYSIIVLLSALFPLVLWNGGLSEGAVWRLACGVQAVQISVYYLVRYRTLREDRSHIGTAWVWRSYLAIDGTFVMLLAGNALFVPEADDTLFVAHLFWLVIGMALTFAGALTPIWKREP